jgi:hypothetical protein
MLLLLKVTLLLIFEAKEDIDQITFELSDNLNVSEVLQRGNFSIFSK